MRNRIFLLQVALNFLLVAAALLAYDRLVRIPATPPMQKFAVLDVAEIYALKEKQFAALLIKADAGEADRKKAMDLARDFGREFETLLKALPRECQCLVLQKAAFAGMASDVRDLTPEIRKRLGL